MLGSKLPLGSSTSGLFSTVNASSNRITGHQVQRACLAWTGAESN